VGMSNNVRRPQVVQIKSISVVEHVAFTRHNNYHSHQAVRSGHAPMIITDLYSPFVSFLVYILPKCLALFTIQIFLPQVVQIKSISKNMM
jgi:hypothetical protein